MLGRVRTHRKPEELPRHSRGCKAHPARVVQILHLPIFCAAETIPDLATAPFPAGKLSMLLLNTLLATLEPEPLDLRCGVPTLAREPTVESKHGCPVELRVRTRNIDPGRRLSIVRPYTAGGAYRTGSQPHRKLSLPSGLRETSREPQPFYATSSLS